MDGNLIHKLLDLPVLGEAAHPLAVLLVLQAADVMLTLVHSLQELKGRLWDYFGAIVGVRIPQWLGLLGFFGGLTIVLWLVGIVGIGGAALWPSAWTMSVLGLLIGCRVSDGIFSHVLLHVKRYRPNPGLASVPVYFAEAVFLAVLFRPRLATFAFPIAIGFLLGAAAFYCVIPLLGRFGPRIWPARERWRPGTPRPS